MKALLALAFLFSAHAYAVQSTIYCKPDDKVINAFSEDGHFDCAGDLAQGGACFTGKAEKIVAIINNRQIDWDEEWLDEAKILGNDSIAYKWVDGPNEYAEDLIMNRCTDDFFRKN